MPKSTHTHYYVQAQKEGCTPEIVCHSQDEETKEYYHKFLEKRKALDLATAEKKLSPEVKFRVVKCTETYESFDWF